MSNEIELVSDGDGIAMFGDPREVELFLATSGVPSKEITLCTPLGSALTTGSSVAQAGSQIAANSGRWVKLTEESAKALTLGKAMTGSTDGVSRAIVTTSKGKVTKILEFVKPGAVGSILTNPAMLAGAAGIMAQLAMQQTMEEITQYLKVIDEKVDDVLSAQKDAALAEVIGVGGVIDEAMLKREHVGRVSEVTWSSLHGAAQTIATTQSYALRRVDALSEKLQKARKVGGLAKVAADAGKDIEEWLAVLARCFQLQDGLAVLELDRVLDSSPDDLDRHREAIRAGRARRRDLIVTTTQHLLERMDAAAVIANAHVLTHPIKANAVVGARNAVDEGVANFHTRLGIQQERTTLEAKQWVQAAGDVKDTVAHAVEARATATARRGAEAFANAKASGKRLSRRFVERPSRLQKDASQADDSEPQRQER